MPKITVHMIGQAHLDPVWLWRWTEGRAEALGTSQSAVDRLAEYPDFHFTRGESQVYAWIEAENPALFAQIKQAIAAGRWHVVNGMVIQPDMNLPAGESFVRQVLLGKRYMRAHLGVEPTVAYCVDSFGHAGTLPQILRRCGFDAYVFMRPGPHEKELPASVFWWQAPDGSRILTFRIAGAYTTWEVDQEQHILQAVAAKPPELDATMCFFGVGNHGGGPTKAQIENVLALAEKYHTHADAAPDADAPTLTPTPAPILRSASAGPTPFLPPSARRQTRCRSWPTSCSFMPSAAIPSTARSRPRTGWPKTVCWRPSGLAVMAALWAGKPVPHARLDELWHILAFNQFHDTLGGSSIKVAEDDAIAELTGLAATAATLADDAARAVANRIDTGGPGATVVLFNPAAAAASTYVEYEPWTGWQNWDEYGWGLVDEAGAACALPEHRPHGGAQRAQRPHSPPALPRHPSRRRLPHLPLCAGPAAGARHRVSHSNSVSVLAPTCNRGRYRRRTGERPPPYPSRPRHRQYRLVHRQGVGLRTRRPRRLERRRGDRRPQRHLVARRPALRRGHGHLWRRRDPPRRPRPPAGLAPGRAQLRPQHLAAADHPAPGRAGDPRAQLAHVARTLAYGQARLRCQHRRTPWPRTTSPLAPSSALATATSTPRTCGWTSPARLQDGQTIGLALLNDGKYGCDVTGSTLRLTILRCVPYAYHDPHPFGTRQRYDWVDLGSQSFTFVLRPHVGDWRDTDIVARARALNQPPLPVTMHAHPGDLPPSGSLYAVDNPDVEVTACKRAEDGDGYIVRLADVHGRGSRTTLTWLGQPFAVEVSPFEVVTVRLEEKEGAWALSHCDMLERPS